MPTDALTILAEQISSCRACPRLVEWREQVAVEKRASYRHDTYWGRGVPGFGDDHASVLVLGLAPAAHGANRTGRVFTGDRSGDWLFRAMHRAGLANQPTSVSIGDGLTLRGAWVSAAVRCAPPANKPTPDERRACLPFLQRELALLRQLKVVVVLGHFAYEVVRRDLLADTSPPLPKFGHGAAGEVTLANGRSAHIVCSYHPSQQNTFTGTLTEAMLDDVMGQAAHLGRR